MLEGLVEERLWNITQLSVTLYRKYRVRVRAESSCNPDRPLPNLKKLHL